MKSASLFLATLSALTATGAAQNLCEQYSSFTSTDGYYFNNNAWGQSAGTGTQCTYIDSHSTTGVSWHSSWSWSGGDNSVKSFPYSGRTMSTKSLVSSIGSLPTAATWSYTGTSIRADVAYDLFTASDPNHETSSGDYEIMIWLAQIGGVEPIGDIVGTVNVNNNDWSLYDGYNGDMRVFSFVAPVQRTDFAADLMTFFDYVTDNRGFPASSQYLITMQFGTEPFTGTGSTFKVSNWNADIY